MNEDEFTPEELRAIEEDCAMWANNCGGCETCDRMFKPMPSYDHYETFKLVQMIKARDAKIKELAK